MISAFKRWLAKQKLKRELKNSFKKNDELVFFDAVEEVIGVDYDTAMRNIELYYLEQGLTQNEIDKVRKNRGPVCISG